MYRKYQGILALVFLLLNTGCGSYYYCLNKKQDRGHHFGVHLDGVTLNHMSFYYTSLATDYQEILTSSSKGGTYNIKEHENKIILRYIQDTVLTKLGLPSGEVLKNENTVWDRFYKKEFDFLIVYHGTFPVIQEYIFNKKSPHLKVLYHYGKLKPRKVLKITWILNPKGKAEQKTKEALSLTKAEKLFSNQKAATFEYPLCKKESLLKGWFHYIINILQFP